MLKEKIKSALTPSSTGVRRGLAVFALVLFIVPCFFLQASATETHNFPISRPTVTDNSCYFEVVTEDNSCYVYCVTVSSFVYSFDSNVSVSTPKISFTAKVDDNGSLWVTCENSSGQNFGDTMNFYGIIFNQYGSSSLAFNSNNNSGLYVGKAYKSIKAYNCIGKFNGNSSVFVYSNEINVNEKLDTIIATLQQNNQASNNIVGSINQGTQDIKDNQDKNTEAIIENDKQLQENEKNEANSAGSSGVADVEEVIPNYSDSIIENFQDFVNCFCHTSCDNLKLTVPEFKTPEFAGIIPSFKIWDSFTIDFDKAIDEYIPKSILFLAQFILSAGVTMWAVYEIYDLIEYFASLNNRKGG